MVKMVQRKLTALYDDQEQIDARLNPLLQEKKLFTEVLTTHNDGTAEAAPTKAEKANAKKAMDLARPSDCEVVEKIYGIDLKFSLHTRALCIVNCLAEFRCAYVRRDWAYRVLLQLEEIIQFPAFQWLVISVFEGVLDAGEEVYERFTTGHSLELGEKYLLVRVFELLTDQAYKSRSL